MKSCYRCQYEIVTKDRLGRRETCSRCGADLHCCLNCTFYDTHYANLKLIQSLIKRLGISVSTSPS